MKYAVALLTGMLWLAPAAAQEERGSSFVCLALDAQAKAYYHSRTFEADPAVASDDYERAFLDHVRSQFGPGVEANCQFTNLPQNVPTYLEGLRQQCPDCAVYTLQQVEWTPGKPTAPKPAKFVDGTYVLEGGSYSMEVRQEGDDLVVVEPNKTSRYVRQPEGAYNFVNPTNGISYWLRVIDDRTIEAFKKESGNVASRLVRVGGGSGSASAPANPAAEIAERYKALSQSDPDNAQAWTACAAAALKRSLATKAEADAYGARMVEVLKLIIVDPDHSPCEDAIPQTLWNASDAAAEGESSAAVSEASASEAAPAAPSLSESELQQMQVEEMLGRNEEGWQRIQAQTEAATKAQEAAQRDYEAKVQAFQAGVEAAEAARQQYERDRAAHEAEVAKAKAARAQWEAEVGNE